MSANQSLTVKVTDVVCLRHMIREKCPDSEYSMLEILTSAARRIYETSMPSAKISQELESEIIAAGAQLICPGHSAPVRELSRQLTHCSMSTVYKSFLRIPNTRVVAKSIPYLWRMFFNKGDCRITELRPNSAKVSVSNFPELIPPQLEELAGTITGILEMTGAQDIQIILDGSDANNWRWQLHWLGKNA